MSHLDPDPLRPPDDEPPYVPIAGALRWGCCVGLLAAILSTLAVVALIVWLATPRPAVVAIPAAAQGQASGNPPRLTGAPHELAGLTGLGSGLRAGSGAPPSPVGGIATWYHAPSAHDAAAGPGLRRALGPGWRGTDVRVCAADRCLTTRLTDWCACPGGRVIDLDRRAFARLAAPSRGVIAVTVERLGATPTLPATDTAP